MRLDSHAGPAKATCWIHMRPTGERAHIRPSAGKTCGHMCFQVSPSPVTSCASRFLVDFVMRCHAAIQLVWVDTLSLLEDS